MLGKARHFSVQPALRRRLGVSVLQEPLRASLNSLDSEDPEKRRCGISSIRNVPSALVLAASCSGFGDVRRAAANMLHDMDSLSAIIESSLFEDSRAVARQSLLHRLDSFSDTLLEHLQKSSKSECIREAAAELLALRR